MASFKAFLMVAMIMVALLAGPTMACHSPKNCQAPVPAPHAKAPSPAHAKAPSAAHAKAPSPLPCSPAPATENAASVASIGPLALVGLAASAMLFL